MTSSSVSSPRQVVERVEHELRDLWSASATVGEQSRTRACTMNIVVVSAEPSAAERLLPMVDELTRTVPARAIVVELDAAGVDGLEGEATAVCDVGERGAICSERVRLVARGSVCRRVASAVEALSVSEMPTTVLWLGPARVDDPVFVSMAAPADRIVLDSEGATLASSRRGAGEGASLASLVEVARWARAHHARPAPADVSWTRLSVWQELCARFFDDPRVRQASLGVTRIALTQACASKASLGPSGALLLGWLATRLGWKHAGAGGGCAFRRPDGGAVAVDLAAAPTGDRLGTGALVRVSVEAEGGGASVRGVIEREARAEDVLAWRLETSAKTIEQRVRLRGDGGARLLERTLRRPRQDVALLETAAFLEPLSGADLVCA